SAHVAQRRGSALKTRVGANPTGGTTACSPMQGVPLKTERLQVQVLPRGPFWNVNRTSVPGLGANECAQPFLNNETVCCAECVLRSVPYSPLRCLERAGCGASPRHSAIHARVAQREPSVL